MPFLQPSIERKSFPTEEPWDWNVEEVIFALTNIDSLLLKANLGLALPDLALFANNLRRNDVNGLALLTEITGNSLRDELGLTSMSHRASINYLIRLLKKQSHKYGEHFGFLGRESSFGDISRFTTPFPGSPQRFGQRAASTTSGSGQTSNIVDGSLQACTEIGGELTLIPNRKVECPYDIGTDEIQSPRAQQIASLSDKTFSTTKNLEAPVVDDGREGQDGGRVPEGEECLHIAASPDYPTPSIHSEEKTGAAYPEQSKRQGEMIITEETGRKRRRLVLGKVITTQVTDSDKTGPTLQEGLPISQCGFEQRLGEAYEIDAKILPAPESSLNVERELLTGTLESSVHARLGPPRAVLLEVVPEPGAITLDEQGRKRMRPFLLSGPVTSVQESQGQELVTGTRSDLVPSALPSFPRSEALDETGQRLYGRKPNRSPHQVYIGLEPLSVDSIFYGGVNLEKNLAEDPQPLEPSSQSNQTKDFYNFTILSGDELCNGQRLYVSSRMKYFLQSRSISLKRNGQKHVGVIPYPDHISRKHHPLSVTIFSKSSNGIIVSRSNRSRWIKDTAVIGATKYHNDVFHVADPSFAQNENDDPEWRSLEKWKYMEGEDKILPVYGDSGSEGEYELDTWYEIKQEQGELVRPLGRSKSKKLALVEVRNAIDEALKQMNQNWLVKRLPNLQRKAWRIWAKSRRDGNTKAQVRLLTLENEKLEMRISVQKTRIAQEMWSTSGQVAKQCVIMQPSVFDREDSRWKISILKSKTMPAKEPPAPKKDQATHIPKATDMLKDEEEVLISDLEHSESSDDGSLDDFIVEDTTDVEISKPLLGDDCLHPDMDDGVESGSLAGSSEAKPTVVQAATEDGHIVPIMHDKSDSDSLMGGKFYDVKEETNPPSIIHHPKETISATRGFVTPVSNFIDLTQQSDPIESQTPLKAEIPYGIKTPPAFDSENDSEVFQRSRTKRQPVFKRPSAVLETVEIIDLDSDSAESVRAQSPLATKTLPLFTDVSGIRTMDPSELVERQDRKRLLIWMIAHAPHSRRNAAFDYLMDATVKQSYKDLISALKDLRRHKRHMRGYDQRVSDNIMQVATWYHCWTIPVKADISGLKSSDIATTIADKDGYEPFYSFLLECMDYYQSERAVQGTTTPQKQRGKAVQADSTRGSEVSLVRKRKNQVLESQATIEKRLAARERLVADEERREVEEDHRREQLRCRFTHIGSEDVDLMGVVVNPGKLKNQDSIHLSARFGNGVRLKPHQKAGLQFMWREITADHEDLQGCLLAQTMGLGKTMQVIALLVALSEAGQSSSENTRNQVPPSLLESRSLILCPPALVENWWDEFILWVPEPSSETIGIVRKVNSSLKLSERLLQIYTWHDKGGVLLIGYDTFKSLIDNKATKTRAAPLRRDEHVKVKRVLLDGPNLVVADEAHHFKSKSTGLNLAMNRIKTKSRIALTGSPLNNNLLEYYTLIDWISPGYLGTMTEFKATYEEVIREGLYQDSTASQKRESLKRLKALELEMEPKVHRANVSVLHNGLQGKSEFVIRVPLTKLQDKAYNIYVEAIHDAIRGGEPCVATLWSWLGVLQLLCNHPKCYLDKLLKLKAESEDPSKRKTPQPQKVTVPASEIEGLLGSDEDAPLMEEPVSQKAISHITAETKRLFDELAESVDAVSLSNKMQILMSILSFAEVLQDKVLVFTHRIPILDYIGKQLTAEGKPYARIDGLQNPNKRQQITKNFNEGSVNVCLISTRAGGTGLNLFGANRVVILDDHFNPMWEQQAIGRAYRFGQKKSVFVYRLTAAGTFEQALQNQAIFKEHLATRVVDKKNPTRNALKGAGEYLFPPRQVKQEDLSKYVIMDPSVLGRILADQIRHVQADVRFPLCLLLLMSTFRNPILSITPSETFHIEDDIELTPAEKLEVEQMQQDEQLRRKDPKAYMARIEQRRGAYFQRRDVNIPSGIPATRPAESSSTTLFDSYSKYPLATQPTDWHQPMSGMDASHLSSTAPVGTHPGTPPTLETVTAVGKLPPPLLESKEDTLMDSCEDQRLSIPTTVASTVHGTHTFVSDGHSSTSSTDHSGFSGTKTDTTSKGPDERIVKRIDALGSMITALFRSASLVPVELQKSIPERIQQTAVTDFSAIMARKGLATIRTLHAKDLHQRILLRSPNENVYRNLVTDVKLLLDQEDVEPMHLVQAAIEKLPTPSKCPDANQEEAGLKSQDRIKINGENQQSKAKPKQAFGGILARSDGEIEIHPKSKNSSGTPKVAPEVRVLHTSVNGYRNDRGIELNNQTHHKSKYSNEGNAGRKHRLSKDGIREAEKTKRAKVTAPNFSGTGRMETDFSNFLYKEASRASTPR